MSTSRPPPSHQEPRGQGGPAPSGSGSRAAAAQGPACDPVAVRYLHSLQTPPSIGQQTALSPCRAPSPPQGGDEGAGLAEEPGTRGRAHRPGRGTKGRSLSEGAQSSRGVAPAGGCQGLLQTAARPPRRGTGSPTGRRGSRPLTRSLGVSQAQRPPGAAVSASHV